MALGPLESMVLGCTGNSFMREIVPQFTQQYQASQGAVDNSQSNRLAQLNLLGQLGEQGTLTEDEFQAEKQRILNG